MAAQNVALLSFNRGLISPQALARTDLKRTALSAELMNNWMCRVWGSMMLRPGLRYVGEVLYDAPARFIPFEFALADTALFEFTNQSLRVWVGETPVTRVAVATTVTNGTFSGNITGWTSADQSGCTSSWATGNLMQFVGNGFNFAIRYQQVTVASADAGKEHALRIVVQDGQVDLLVGSTQGAGDYVALTALGTGTHSIAFTPNGNFYVQFQSLVKRKVTLSQCTVEAAGVMILPTSYTSADLGLIRGGIDAQSLNIGYFACSGYQQQKIERRNTNAGYRSWSFVLYQPIDGPFNTINGGTITIAPSGLSGNITLTASQALFTAGHVGALFRLASSGQNVSVAAAGTQQWSGPIKVTGVGAAQRQFQIIITGTWVATVQLQYSAVSSTGPWTDVPGESWTTNQNFAYSDGLDNQIIWYQIGIENTYTSGTATCQMIYTGGEIKGIVRVTAFTDTTHVNAEVIEDLGGTSALTTWYEGIWSTKSGWPTAVTISEGRIWWSGQGLLQASVSGTFESFDDTVTGDSAPINNIVGSGPVNNFNWLLPMRRLLCGGDAEIYSVFSSILDGPITTADYIVKTASSQGSAPVAALKVDKMGIAVQRGGTRILQLQMGQSYFDYDYSASLLNLLVPEVTQAGVVRMAVQRQPDTRIHCVLADGTVAVCVFDLAEEVACWLTVSSPNGFIEDAVVLPSQTGQPEDSVYYVVRRTIAGTTKRYLECWALESECQGGQLNKQVDSFIVYNSVSTATITGLATLNGLTVSVWGNGVDLGTYTVANGQVTLSTAVTQAVIGIPYTAQWKSSKMAYATQMGTALGQRKRIPQLGVILRNTHYQGLKYGKSFTDLMDLPAVIGGTPAAANTIKATFDEDAFSFPGSWDTDSRVCLQAASPRPCTVLAAIATVEAHEKT